MTTGIEPTNAELFPFTRARWGQLGKRGLTAPILMISAAVALLFYYQGEVGLGFRVQRVCNNFGVARLISATENNINPDVDCSIVPELLQRSQAAAERFSEVFGLTLLGLFVYFVYARAGRRVTPTVLFGIFIIFSGSMWMWSDSIRAPLFFLIRNPLEYVFGGVGQEWGLAGIWFRTLLTTGIAEESYKLIPLALALWATTNAREPWRTRLRVTEPLDGITISVTAAAAFIYSETFSLYARGELNALLGLQLSIPRVLGGMAGHIAYSTVAAYYVTLGWTRSKHKWLYVVLGVFAGAALHATWNTFGSMGGGMLGATVTTLLKILAFGITLTVLQTAREFSPARAALAARGITFGWDTATLETPVAAAAPHYEAALTPDIPIPESAASTT